MEYSYTKRCLAGNWNLSNFGRQAYDCIRAVLIIDDASKMTLPQFFPIPFHRFLSRILQ